MDELGKSITQAIKNRSTSAALGTFTFFWLLLHSEGVYTTFFVDQAIIYKKYGLLKNEYVYRYFFGYRPHLAIWRISLPIDLGFLSGLILAFALTFAFIWFVPKLFLIYAYQQEQEHKTAKKRIRYAEEQKVLQFEVNSAKKRTDVIDAEINLTQKEKQAESVDPEIVWAKDFEMFSTTPEFGGFSLIIDAVYNYGGHTKRYFDSGTSDKWINVNVPPNVLAAADANGLITLDTSTYTIMLTNKGKYFVKRFQASG